MKKSVLLGITALTAVSLLSGCTDEWGTSRSGSGSIIPIVGLDSDVKASEGAEARSRADGEVTTADLSLRLSNADGSLVRTFETVADFPVDEEFKVGQYTLEAFYGDADAEGFECPSYYGIVSFPVADGVASEVNLTASQANAMISIAYTDAFKGYMSSWSATVKGKASHEYSADETRPVYVAAGAVEISISFTKPNGKGATTVLPVLTAVEGAHHYIITVNVNDGNVGDATMTVTFPDELKKEVVEIDLSDKILSAQVPQVTADGFTDGTPVEVVSGLPFDQTLAFNAVAQAGLGTAVLSTVSPSLIAQGWPAEVDLMAADEATKAKLTSLGLSVLGLWNNPDKMAVVDLSGVVKNIKVDADANKTAQFTFVVTDKIGRSSVAEGAQPATLSLALEEVDVVLEKVDEYYHPGEDLTISLSYNGPAPEENVKFEYFYSGNGHWQPLEVKSITAASRTMTLYNVVLATPNVDDTLRIRATAGSKVSAVLEAVMPPFELTIGENDVYATTAFAKIRKNPGSESIDFSTLVFSACADGQSTYQAISATPYNGEYYKLSGLTPSTTYSIKAVAGGFEPAAVRRTTEATAQLPNNEMEEWSVDATRKQPDGYWQLDYPNANQQSSPWATMNALTTSQGSTDKAGLFGKTTICGYCAKSGTTPVTENAYSGTAAMIQSVGWGDGNTAPVGGGKVEHTTFGELYLGQYNSSTEQPEYTGLSFSSRPASLSFYTKYERKNSADYGYAEIRMLDAAGNVIRSNSVNVTNTDLETVTVPLEYQPGDAKATRIVVIFKSSNNPSCLPYSSGNYTLQKSTSLKTSGGYVGSKLYVDHIMLNY